MKRNKCDPKRRASFPPMMIVFCVFFFFLFCCSSAASAGKHQRAKHSSSFSRVVDEENFDTFAEINGNDIGNDGGPFNSILSDLMWVTGRRKESQSLRKVEAISSESAPLPPLPRKAARHLNRKHSQSARQITHRKSRNTESTSL